MSNENQQNIQINVDKRIIYIHDFIDKNTMSAACFNLLFILNEDNIKEQTEKNFTREPIKIYINSNGGYLQDAWAFIDIMLNSKSPIYTYSTGYAHSSGFLVFLAGSKRFITKHTRMCCHQFSGGAVGTYQDIKEQIENLDKTWKVFEKYILSRTNISKSKLKTIREKKLDWYIYSDESIELGVATDIVESF